MIKRVEVYDMDGVLVDSSHRYIANKRKGKMRINLAYWRKNEPKCMKDKLLPLAKHYKKSLACPNTYVIIATARVLRAKDWQYITTILGTPDKVIFRTSEHDNQSAVTLKANPLKVLKQLKQFKDADWHFYEDNKKNAINVSAKVGMKWHYIKSKQGW